MRYVHRPLSTWPKLLIALVGLVMSPAALALCSQDPAVDDRVPGDPLGQFVFHEENDAFAIGSGSDEGYTQGLRLSYAYNVECEPRWSWRIGNSLRLSRLGGLLGLGSTDSTYMTTTLGIGQHLFTPNNLADSQLIPTDRPYGAFLYGDARYDFTEYEIDPTELKLSRPLFGGEWFGQKQTSLELQAGVIGPAAGGEFSQSKVHELIGDEDPKGWDNQLPDEPAVQAKLTWRMRVAHKSKRFDVVPSAAVAIGTVQSYVSTGVTLRYGKNLTGFHSDPLGPTADPRDILNKIDAVCGLKIFAECYGFVGVEGRAFARNSFLDGTLFRDSHSVDSEKFVYDLLAGFRMRFLWRSLTLDYTFVRRSNEFSPVPAGADQPDGTHDYGAIVLRWTTTFP